ncbi:hypothetical protein DFH08DRAFT_770865 [Mycena albidolilacea]|uniref:DNA endonuclease activator Ctp1 C-terminal domain-containing protein n=1 Tax=Mycena albidolilacea TaxID=1033008 RepID=A0AAD7AEQ0_9AGAR|nr:hypothetical protein DFH08DRAFT_770865 [Mycena albidolilacea]
MPPANITGADLRVRDKAIEEKHSKEVAALNAKIQRLRHAYDGRSDEYFASVNYGHRIADLLGFRSLDEVQTFIELADEVVKYKDLANHVDELKAELAIERRDKQAMEHDLIDVTEERDLLKVALAEQSAKLAESSAEALAKELVALQSRYNEVSERANRADIEIKDNMAKWRAFKKWMQNDEKEFKEKKKSLSSVERMREREASQLKRRQKLKEVGLDRDDDPPNELVVVHETPIQKTTRSTMPPTFSSSPTVIASERATPAAKDTGKSPVASSTRTPLQFVHIRGQTTTNPHSSPLPPSSPMQSNDVIDLSETQDDSQGPLFAQEIPARPEEDEGEDEVIGISFPATPAMKQKSLAAPHPALPARPNFPQFGVDHPRKQQRITDVFTAAPARARARPDSEHADQEPPRKIRRFSSPVRAPLGVTSPNGVRTSRNSVGGGTSRGSENRAGRRGNKDQAPASTPANTSASKQLADYSAFKGRGRYGKAAAGNDAINSSYAIDPARNGGVDFQYDAVVRGKDDRRRMDGGDCECCRDYYEAVGPMPSRLQPPLWRSPRKSGSTDNDGGYKPCRNGNGRGGREESIQAHKQAISRHRHDWAQGTTPPSYWNIGFPSTQEAQMINEKAAEMQQQKMRMVQQEAENGGRYYKTR